MERASWASIFQGKLIFYWSFFFFFFFLRLNLPLLPRVEIIRVMPRDYRVGRCIALLPSRGTNMNTLVCFLRNLSKSNRPYILRPGKGWGRAKKKEKEMLHTTLIYTASSRVVWETSSREQSLWERMFHQVREKFGEIQILSRFRYTRPFRTRFDAAIWLRASLVFWSLVNDTVLNTVTSTKGKSKYVNIRHINTRFVRVRLDIS